MANPKTLREAAEEKSTAAFPIETLRGNCMKLFGVSSAAFDGAFYGKEGEYTIEAAGEIIRAWGKEEVAK